MSKDFLSAEGQAKVVEAAEKDLETVEETTVTEPAGGPAPTPDAADTAGSTPGEETQGEEQAAAEVETKKGPVPYDRFHEVNAQKNEALERARLMEERLAREVEVGSRARAQAILEDIARRRPELAAEIYGPESEQAKALKPEPLPEDPVQRELTLLKREAQESKAYREKQVHMDMVRSMEERAEAAMEDHPILSKNERIQALAESTIVQRILAKPQVPVEKVVEEVASDFRHFEESIKAEYKLAKVEAVKKVPAGVGSGGTAPPGAARKKFSLERPGELAKAFASAMNQGE